MPESDVVKENKVLVYLPHISHMWYHRYTEFARQQADRKKFADSSYARAINLHESYRLGLQVVLELDAIGYMFAECERNRSDLTAEYLMSQHVVGVRGFFDPIWGYRGKLPADRNSFRKRPLLIGIQHDGDGLSRKHAYSGRSSDIQVGIDGTHFDFEGAKACAKRLPDSFPHLLIAVAEPAHRGVIPRITAQ